MNSIAGPLTVYHPDELKAVTAKQSCENALIARDDPMKQGCGAFFDEFITLWNPEGARFTERVSEIYYDIAGGKRRGAKSASKVRLRALLANAMRAEFYRTSHTILYFRGSSSPWYSASPSWMKHGGLARAVDVLVDAGLLEGIVGKLMPHNSRTRSYASSFRPTGLLLAIATECGITKGSIGKHIAYNQLVRLFGPKYEQPVRQCEGSVIRFNKGKPVQFNPTRDTQRWSKRIQHINSFYRTQKICLPSSGQGYQESIADNDIYSIPLDIDHSYIETFQTDLYRVFNNGLENKPTFCEGGRLYGGWWMSLPPELRKTITINDQPTVEFDYSSCHPRMLYHEMGLQPRYDLYDVPEVLQYEYELGLPAATYRTYVKWLVQVMINGRGKPHTVELPDNVLKPMGLSAKQVVEYIEKAHPALAGAFNTGAGMRLMRVESDIALEIVATAAAQGWTVLPIHDSFIATIDKTDQLRYLMVEVYRKHVGQLPVIK